MKRKASLNDALNRVTAGDLGKFENGEMQFNEVISFLADMVTIGNDNPKWQETFIEKAPYANTVHRLRVDGHIDAAGNVLQWFGK
jgi:hypothetical protein